MPERKNMEKKQSVRMMLGGVAVEEKTRMYIEKKLDKLNRLSEDRLKFEVEIGLAKKGFFRVEIMAKTPRQLYRAEEETESIEASTDIVCDELQIQIKNAKNKAKDLERRGARSIKKKIVIDKSARF